MKWMRFRVRTKTEAEDILVEAMTEVGLFGAQIEDNVPLTAAEKEAMFVDIMPISAPDDGTAALSFYAEENDEGLPLIDGEPKDPAEVVEAMKGKLAELKSFGLDIGEGTLTVEETEDIDWINSWKQYFHQFWIDDILVIPSWEEAEEPEKKPSLVFHVDPGTAFGTGMHETTQLCVRAIREAVTPETDLLDVGTGSGILAILSLMLGARHCTGTDLDPCAIPAIEDNLKANGVDPSKFDVILGNLIDDPKVQEEVGFGRYDICAANILPNVLCPLMPAMARAMKDGALLVCSGILIGKEQPVIEAMEREGIRLTEVRKQGEWCAVLGRKAV